MWKWIVVAGLTVTAIALVGVAEYRAAHLGPYCTTPAAEPEVLRAYLAEPVMATPPKPDGAPAAYRGTAAYCRLDGVDVSRPQFHTSQWVAFETTGWWPSAALRARYDPVATAGGWTYVRQADQDPARYDTCFWVTVGPVRACQGNGVEYCKSVDGVVSLLDVSGQSRRDIPNFAAEIRIEIDAWWTARACPTALGGASPTS